MGIIEDRRCSRCGSFDHLSLVTLRYSDTESAGRILLYCGRCREWAKLWIGVTITIEELTPDIFLDLYRTKQTASDPYTAVEIAFGESKPLLVQEAKRILKSHDDRLESPEEIQDST
jgi:hypothetical protein